MKGIGNLVMFVLLWLLLAMLTVGIGLLLIPVYWFFVFKGSDGRIQKAEQKLQSSLIKNETVVTSGLQMRLYALFNRRQLIAITNSRMILISRSVFGGFTMRDYQWKDLLDAQLSENILPNLCGSCIKFKVNQNPVGLILDGIASSAASAIYSHAQAQEQEWEEKRRIRTLEDKRAASGGTIVHTGAPSPAVGSSSTFDDLERAKKLLDSGTISDSEYQEMKSKILSRGTF